MKRTLIAAALATALLTPAVMSPTAADAACYGSTWVDGYTRSDGTYVSGHSRSCPNSSTADNWSSSGSSSTSAGQASPWRDESGHIDVGRGTRSAPWSSDYSGWNRFYP